MTSYYIRISYCSSDLCSSDLTTGNCADDGTAGLAAGYDFGLGSSTFVGAEIAGDKVLVDCANVQFSAGGRVGAKIGANGKLYATGGYTFGDVDDPYGGAGSKEEHTSELQALMRRPDAGLVLKKKNI